MIIQPTRNEVATVARDFSDYLVMVDDAGLPSGVTLQSIVG